MIAVAVLAEDNASDQVYVVHQADMTTLVTACGADLAGRPLVLGRLTEVETLVCEPCGEAQGEQP